MQTASPGQLVLMLFDGAIRFLELSLQGFGKDDPAEFAQTISNNVIRAQDILHELDLSLDIARGGEFAQNLHRLYDYLDRRLMESNLDKKPDGIREVIDRLTIIRDAWAKMLTSQAGAAAQPQVLFAERGGASAPLGYTPVGELAVA